MKHKHSEVIKVFADGVQCEYLGERTNKWCDIKELVAFDAYETVRIKPEPQKELAQPRICQLENQLQNARKLIKEQDEKICELAIKLAYAELDLKLIIDEAKLQELQKQEPQYLYVYNDINTNKTCMSPTLMQETYGWNYMGKVRVEK
jgi:chaperonin GroEL (HSP60 family)